VIRDAATRVLLCDDHRLYVDALGLAIGAHGMRVVGTATSGDECLDILSRESVDVCVVDRCLGDWDGLELVSAITSGHDDVRVLVLSGSVDPALSRSSILAGANGFASKELGIERLVGVIRKVHIGEMVDEHAQVRPTSVERAASLITARERAVLERLVLGQDTARLAQDLGISYATARTHIQNLLTKLGVHSKLELVAFAMQHRLVPLRSA
jgi:two-component system nitrate/nitrite response regulator NarL